MFLQIAKTVETNVEIQSKIHSEIQIHDQSHKKAAFAKPKTVNVWMMMMATKPVWAQAVERSRVGGGRQ